jgi:preprotein translocase subunit SecG
MSEALDRLKDIGAQKIYEDTHIPVEHVQAILYESFDGLSKVQFIGFISILEREYGEDLSAVRARVIDYFNEKSASDEAITDDTIFKSSNSKKNLTVVYIILAIILLFIAIYYTMQSADQALESAVQESKIIQEVKKNIVLDTNVTKNSSSDVNTSQKAEDFNATANKPEVEKTEEKAVPKSLKIIARTKVWLGYIDAATNKKYQKTFKGELDLDPTKEWLLYFGHGYIDVIVDGKERKFSEKDTLRLHYENGEIKEISIDEFRRLNRGNTW